MRVDPISPEHGSKATKRAEINKLTESLTRIVAIVIAFISVYFFFIKLLFL